MCSLLPPLPCGEYRLPSTGPPFPPRGSLRAMHTGLEQPGWGKMLAHAAHWAKGHCPPAALHLPMLPKAKKAGISPSPLTGLSAPAPSAHPPRARHLASLPWAVHSKQLGSHSAPSTISLSPPCTTQQPRAAGAGGCLPWSWCPASPPVAWHLSL